MKKDMNNPIRNPKYKNIAIALIAIGIAFLIAGIILFILGFLDMQNGNFFYGFIAIPCLFIGSSSLMYGLLGPLARFMQGVAAPIQKDYVNYMREETVDSAKGYYGDIASSVKENLTSQDKIVCENCHYENEKGAKYCNHCGHPLEANVICPSCGKENKKGSTYCSKCGKHL